jgi:hypothetical protein
MSTPYGGWTVQTQWATVIDENGKCKDDIVTSLEVEDVRNLPAVIHELAKWGHDLSATAKAIKDAQEEQQKAKQAKSLKAKREGTAKAKAALDSSIQRFIIAYNKQGEDEVKTGQGVCYGDGSLSICMDVEFPVGGHVNSEEWLRGIAERMGYEYHIEYMD